ncbi:MAG: hypothetical protein L0K86_23945 [Actinomycetia bacterium]|nr:hypothetical protein [Actinomycetes bacterium]
MTSGSPLRDRMIQDRLHQHRPDEDDQDQLAGGVLRGGHGGVAGIDAVGLDPPSRRGHDQLRGAAGDLCHDALERRPDGLPGLAAQVERAALLGGLREDGHDVGPSSW